MASKKKKNTNKSKKVANNNLENKIDKSKANEEKKEENLNIKQDIKNESKIENKISEEKDNLKEKEENIIQKLDEIEEENLEMEGKNVTEEKKEEEKKEEEKNVKEDIKNKNEQMQKELIMKHIENKKRRIYIAISILIISAIIIIFSIIFAILNLRNSNVVKGVKIKNIDVSGLSLKEAKTKITEALNIELLQELNLKYNDEYEVALNVNQIEYQYKIDEAINKAYNLGRDGNIIKNNYSLLYVAFFGKNIDIDFSYNEQYLNEIIDDIESKLPGLVVNPTYYIEENQLIINKGTDGIIIDKDKFKNDILTSIKQRNAEEMLKNNSVFELKIPIKKQAAEGIDIEQIYSEVYTEPQNAYYELEPFKIYPEVNGIDLEISIEEAKKQIESEEKDEYRFGLKITPAEKTIKDLGTEAFPYLISSFSTKYDASNKNRSKNLEIAAGKINGTVLLPGEVFSFNKVVGKRTVEEGYKDAKIYADGGVVDGLAGGICQISSTLYNSVLLANLEIVERRNHSFTTSYVPAGRDATVVYGITDFQFKNSRSYPIKIEAEVANGIALFKIHGISEEKEYDIKIIPKTTQSIPYTTQYIQDLTLAPGQQVIVQAGHSGYKVTTYKEVRSGGILVSKEVLSNDTYKAMKAIIRIGP